MNHKTIRSDNNWIIIFLAILNTLVKTTQPISINSQTFGIPAFDYVNDYFHYSYVSDGISDILTIDIN
jgi:hypothetical protein